MPKKLKTIVEIDGGSDAEIQDEQSEDVDIEIEEEEKSDIDQEEELFEDEENIEEIDTDEEIEQLEFASDNEIENEDEIVDETEDNQEQEEEIEIPKELLLKRHLTEAEKEFLVDFLQFEIKNDWDTSVAKIETIKRDLFDQFDKIQIYPDQIPKLKELTRKNYYKSLMNPGQMVGADAALAIGEPTTQLCELDSESVIVRIDDKTIINTTIGELINDLIEECYIVFEDEGSTIVSFELNDKKIEILSVSKDEKLKWSIVTEVSRHPPKGNLVEVTTESGRTNISTLSHSFLRRTLKEIKPIKGSDLSVGDRIPVCLNIPEMLSPQTEIELWKGKTVKLDKKFGEFIGIFIAEGSTCKNSNTVQISSTKEYYKKLAKEYYKSMTNNKIQYKQKEGKILGSVKTYEGFDTCVDYKPLSKWLRKNCGTYCENKHIPAFVFGSKKSFIAHVLRCAFDGDGNVHGNRKSIKYHSISKTLIEQIAILLAYFGIFSTYQIEREETDCTEDLWVLLIFGPKYGKLFYDNIGTNLDYKREEMEMYVNDECGRNFIDQIPNCAQYIHEVGRGLKLPSASRNYSRWLKKEEKGLHVGRNALRKYVELFEKKDINNQFSSQIKYLRQAVDGDVVWDRIIKLEEIIPDKDRFVYDFSVKDTETFALQSGILVHNTLNTFHSSGSTVATVLTGVPRFNEVLNASKKQKTNALSMKLKKPMKNLSETRDKCRILFEEKYISDLIIVDTVRNDEEEYNHLYLGDKKDKIFHDYINNIEADRYLHLSEEDQLWYEFYDKFYSTSYRSCKYSIRLKFDKYLLFQYKLETSKIAKRIEKEYGDCRCVFSPTNIGIVDVYIDTTNIGDPDVIISSRKKTRKKKKDVGTNDYSKHEIIKMAVKKGMDKKKANRLTVDELYKYLEIPLGDDNILADQMFITDKNKDFYFVRDVASDYVMSIKINGIDGIEAIFYVQDKKTEEWSIQTSGTNMRDVMNHPDVDFRSVISNNMWEIFEILGIEAARRFIIHETVSIIGSGIDLSHIELLADAMVRSGLIRAVNRYGIGKEEAGALSMASFEQSHENMLKAAARGEVENCSTVSASIIMGKEAKIGSGYLGLLANSKMLKTSKIFKNVEDDDLDEEKIFQKLEGMMGITPSNKEHHTEMEKKPSLYKQSLEKEKGIEFWKEKEKGFSNLKNSYPKNDFEPVFRHPVVVETYDPDSTEF